MHARDAIILLLTMIYKLITLVNIFNYFRLAEGHAKLMYRTKVEIIDAITAAELIGTTMLNSDVGCPFPTDPIATYYSKGMHIKQCTKLYKYIF